MMMKTREAEILYEHRLGHSLVLRIVKGDLAAERVDAIVNAANGRLAHGGGVAAAIVRRGGQIIQDESNRIVAERGVIRAGESVITGAGDLNAKYVIHTVGPCWGEGDEDGKLARCITSSLELGEEHGIESISFPAVASGIFAFPKRRCAKVILDAIDRYVRTNPHLVLQEIRICDRDDETSSIFHSEAHARYGDQ